MRNLKIKLEELKIDDMNQNILDHFNRYQEVSKVWRVENDVKVIRDIRFIENWNHAKKQTVINELKETLRQNGTVTGSYEGIKLVGFASLSNETIGKDNKYIQLLQLHVSNDYRGKGIGRMLFNRCADKARALGATKLYISAHSSIETISFYTRVGCEDAKWLYKQQVELEPYDCQLECNLYK